MRLALLLAAGLQACAASAAQPKFKFEHKDAAAPCPKELRAARSAEVQKLGDEDQADRQGPFDSIDWKVVGPRDVSRRKRVAEIADEGCLTTAMDYGAAGIIYQHGDTPDDIFHAFTYFKKAVELGDASERIDVGRSADRYLTYSGYKQLFASQFSRPSMDPKDCWCVERCVEGVPDALWSQYAIRKTMKEAFAHADELNAEAGATCPPGTFCKAELKDPPKGILPGFW